MIINQGFQMNNIIPLPESPWGGGGGVHGGPSGPMDYTDGERLLSTFCHENS